MQFKALSLLAAAGVASASGCAYPPLLSLQSAGNQVSRPDSYNPATIGVPFNIIWDHTGWGDSVTIYLLRGPGNAIQYYSTIAESAPNTGSFTWTPDCECPADTTHWGIMVAYSADPSTCSFQWSMQFGLNPAPDGVCSGSPIPSSISSAPTSEPTTYHHPHNGTDMPPPKSSGPGGPGAPWGGPGGPGGGSGAPWGGPSGSASLSNCTSTSTVWVNPTGSSPKSTYTPLQGNPNAGSTVGFSFAAAAAALAAFFL